MTTRAAPGPTARARPVRDEQRKPERPAISRGYLITVEVVSPVHGNFPEGA